MLRVNRHRQENCSQERKYKGLYQSYKQFEKSQSRNSGNADNRNQPAANKRFRSQCSGEAKQHRDHDVPGYHIRTETNGQGTGPDDVRRELNHDDQGQDHKRNMREQVLDIGEDVSLLLDAQSVVEHKGAERQGRGDVAASAHREC